MTFKHKIFMVGYSPNYASWFPFPATITNNPEDATVAWWVGGADIAPWLYGEKEGDNTYVDYQASEYEFQMWNFFKQKPNVLKVGTCKGAQNLACYNGAKMAQHMIHPHVHPVLMKDGSVVNSNSLHHQQIIVDEKITGLKDGIDYDLLGWTQKLSPFHLNGDNEDYNFGADYKEPEILWFEKTKCFGVQAHPEMMNHKHPFVKYCQFLLGEKIKAMF